VVRLGDIGDGLSLVKRSIIEHSITYVLSLAIPPFLPTRRFNSDPLATGGEAHFYAVGMLALLGHEAS
jgi:hypothetical protein